VAKGEAGLFISYCAKDFLDGTQTLNPWEELAYRRICDMIYTTNDRLPDDDRMLAWATKTGRRWPAIKKALTTGERPKLLIVEGRITNLRCQSALGTATRNRAQKVGAGRESASSGKSLKNLKQNRTDVGNPVRMAVPNGTPNLSNKPLEEEDSSEPSGSDAATSAATRADPTKEIFDRGVAILGPRRRSLLGKLCKEHGEPAVLEAIVACEEQQPVEPAAYLLGCLARAGPKTNGGHKPTPIENLYLGAMRAADKFDGLDCQSRDCGDDKPPARPFLDRR
jgi:uncharacterized protein YdaU (DUF1376 family)